MHVVFLNQYYPPDIAPTGVMLEAVVENLVAEGHRVTVICSAGGYGDAGGKVGRNGGQENRVFRSSESKAFRRIGIRTSRFGRGTFAGKLVDYFSYYLGVAWTLVWLQPRPDRVVALTTPPYLSLLARLCSKLRGGDHAHWVMDLYPDVMVAHGMLREDGLVHRTLASLARWGFGGSRCAALLTLGPDMAERLGLLVNPSSSHLASEWIPLWCGAGEDGEPDEAAVAKRRRQMGWADDEIVIMYSGNMGLGHRFDEILDLAASKEGASYRFVFFGGGKRRGEIEEFMVAHPRLAFELHDYVPADRLAEHLRSADVHVASLATEWTGTMVPSKLQGIFQAGRPVIFLGDRCSSIGRWVSESGGGWVVEPGDPIALARALEESRDSAERRSRGAAAMAFSELHFNRASNVRRITTMLARVSGPLCPHSDSS